MDGGVPVASGFNLAADVEQRIGEAQAGLWFVAKVVSVSGGLIKIMRLGQTVADNTNYPAATGLAAAVVANDKVLCLSIGGTVIVTQKIVIV